GAPWLRPPSVPRRPGIDEAAASRLDAGFSSGLGHLPAVTHITLAAGPCRVRDGDAWVRDGPPRDRPPWASCLVATGWPAYAGAGAGAPVAPGSTAPRQMTAP